MCKSFLPFWNSGNFEWSESIKADGSKPSLLLHLCVEDFVNAVSSSFPELL